MTAAQSLQRAIHARLAGDAALAALIGGQRIFDRPIEGEAPPYVVFDEHAVTDWSTADEFGEEHRLTLIVHSAANGRFEAQAIMGAVSALLHDGMVELETARLVNLRLVRSELAREPKARRYRGSMIFRAVTEGG